MLSGKWKETTAYKITTRLQSWYTWNECKPFGSVTVEAIKVYVPAEGQMRPSPADGMYLYMPGQHFEIPYGFSQALARGLIRFEGVISHV